MQRILEAGKAEKGDVLLFVADRKPQVVAAALGALRLEMGKRLGLIDPDKLCFTWVVKFPMFEYSEEEHRYVVRGADTCGARNRGSRKIESDLFG